MKRRKFIRNLGLAGLSQSLVGNILASDACCDLQGLSLKGAKESSSLALLRSLTLSPFEGEHEEGPCLVTDAADGHWLFTLRRLPYPADKELISCFSHENGTWVEQDPVFPEAGQFESVTASCSRGGEPVVAWSCKEGNDWSIMVSQKSGSTFSVPQTFQASSGRYINPVLISPGPHRHWLAWECYEKGAFSICLSKFEAGKWAAPVKIEESGESLLDPAIAEGRDGILYLAYSITDGPHQNIKMKRINGATMEVLETVPVAIGGSLKDRVNLNVKPALAFDREDRLWISWENNRRITRVDVGGNFTGQRICGVVCYENGRIMESAGQGRWLFDGSNDHMPTFVQDGNGNLFLVIQCGGDFSGNPFWNYRLSWLHPETGWTDPQTIHATQQKGLTTRPAMMFDADGHFWLAANSEMWFESENVVRRFGDAAMRVLASRLDLYQFKAPVIKPSKSRLALQEAVVEELHPVRNYQPVYSGRPRIPRRQLTYRGETYTLLVGNLHEHSEISHCWPAGCDGTLHDNFRYGIHMEGYDFLGMTDHGYSLSEIYWRRNLRLTEFYNDPEYFVAVPAMEWTLSNGGTYEIKHGVGHKNVIFPSTSEARKFIRNQHEIFSRHSPETRDAEKLWSYLHEKQIDCVTIPHHPADEIHATDWEVHDPHYQTVVEIFQRRGNAEYPNCPRMIFAPQHRSTENEKAFIDYALKDKHYRMGFIASGDHTGFGIGLAALWVREVSGPGILEALKARRCFATTGDKILVDFRVEGAFGEDVATFSGTAPEMTFKVEAVQPLTSVEIFRNSLLVQSMPLEKGTLEYEDTYVDEDFGRGKAPVYYYLRAMQENNQIAWSSPVWVVPN